MKIKKYFILRNYINFIKSKLSKKYAITYSQLGEDLIIDFIFRYIGIKKPNYLDIGAHDPFYLSNTALLYKNGSNGVCVEPDITLFKKIQKKRKRDICLNIGVGTNSKQKESDFYVMSTRGLNTFSKSEAKRYSRDEGEKIESVIKIPVLSINEIISKNFKGTPNFISIDVEGLDYEILKDFDFDKYRPEVFCVETLTYAKNSEQKKLNHIIQFMEQKNYFVLADTHLNTIFVDKKAWKRKL
jgi:FkbM family methyltransferase